jgi:hypothetical protein
MQITDDEEREALLREKWQQEDNLTRIGVLIGVPIAWAVIITIILSVIMSIGHTIENLGKITERWEYGQYIFVIFAAMIIFLCGVVAGWRLRDRDYIISSRL